MPDVNPWHVVSWFARQDPERVRFTAPPEGIPAHTADCMVLFARALIELRNHKADA
jgi:hypothetical protein